MTDISELVESMSLERIKQIALGDQMTVGERERLAITALFFNQRLKICTDAFRDTGLRQLAAEEALEKAQARIAELEARTVKLPKRLQPGADGWDDWYMHSDPDGEYLKADDVQAMLTAAGIKWESE